MSMVDEHDYVTWYTPCAVDPSCPTTSTQYPRVAVALCWLYISLYYTIQHDIRTIMIINLYCHSLGSAVISYRNHYKFSCLSCCIKFNFIHDRVFVGGQLSF